MKIIKNEGAADQPERVATCALSRRDFLQDCGRLGVGAWLLPSIQREAGAARPSAWEEGYEYAAGPVVLPFAYSAETSPSPQPAGLDFSHQLNPDNCQVFVRIEEELWEFRSQWIINLGSAARFRGPDIDI